LLQPFNLFLSRLSGIGEVYIRDADDIYQTWAIIANKIYKMINAIVIVILKI